MSEDCTGGDKQHGDQYRVASVLAQNSGAILTVASGAAADPIGVGVALVESLTGNLSDVAAMDYVRAGQVIRLGPDQTIVLSYRDSCVRETITGGNVIIGTRRSEVKFGKVQRSEDGQCASNLIALSSPKAKKLVAEPSVVCTDDLPRPPAAI
jgi:hypothetical protein